MNTDILKSIEKEDEHHITKHRYFLKIVKTHTIDLPLIGDSITRRWRIKKGNWME